MKDYNKSSRQISKYKRGFAFYAIVITNIDLMFAGFKEPNFMERNRDRDFQVLCNPV